MTGIITDSAGAAVPQAMVRLSSEATGFAQTATTSEEGAYVFPLVTPGSYQITVEREGFQRLVRTFALEVAQQARIDAQLTVGQIIESVNVSASAVLLEITSSNLGQVISNPKFFRLSGEN